MKFLSKKATKVLAVACAATVTASALVGVSVSFAETGHTHTFSTQWSKDSKNHYHAATCGDNVITDAQAHTYGANDKCTVCGYDKPVPAHVHTYESLWKCDEINHWHASDCKHDIVSDMAAHDFGTTGTCVCGYVQPTPAHKHTYESVWKHDDINHWHKADCDHDIVRDIAKHSFSSGVCECGYTKEVGALEINTGAYNESIYAEWSATSVSDVTVSYQLKGTNSWTQIDSELIRLKGNTVRADAVGLKAGTYNLKVTSGGDTATVSNIEVSAYDRSGYAHFNASEGVGGYNADGTPKSNAQIIYVSEQTKNTVKATINKKEYTGLIAILTAMPKSTNPIIIRVIGGVGAAAWKTKKYTNVPVVNKKTNADPDFIIKNTSSTKGNTLKKQRYTMQELIDLGFNTLDESKYSRLEGLYDKYDSNYMSYMNYDSSKDEFDSCWNNCIIGTGSSKGNYAQNVTIEGVGNDAGFYQWGMTWKYAQSVEVRNLTFDDYTEDACSFEGNTNGDTADQFDSKRIWLHHNNFYEGLNTWDVCKEQDKGDGDGSTDFKKVSYVTIAYNHYIDTHKTGLIGGDDAHRTANVTFHHNYYEHCKARLPLARVANMHMYNNYYKNTTDTCLSIRSGAYAFVEYCYFDNANSPLEVKLGTKKVKSDDANYRQGFVKLYNCTFNKINYTASNYIKDAATREAQYNNDNIYGQHFDTDSTLFYYDSANNCSKVTNLITDVSKIPSLIPTLAGPNK